MVHQDKVCDMAKMEIYREGRGERSLNVRSYRRQDFVALELLKSVILGTAAFLCVIALIVLYNTDIIAQFDNMETITAYGKSIGIAYGIFMAAYLVFTYIYARRKHAAAVRESADYMQRLKRVSKTYASGKRGSAQ